MPGVERQRLVQQRTALRLQALFQQLIAAAGGHGGIHGIYGGGFGVFGGAFGVAFFREDEEYAELEECLIFCSFSKR